MKLKSVKSLVRFQLGGAVFYALRRCIHSAVIFSKLRNEGHLFLDFFPDSCFSGTPNLLSLEDDHSPGNASDYIKCTRMH